MLFQIYSLFGRLAEGWDKKGLEFGFGFRPFPARYVLLLCGCILVSSLRLLIDLVACNFCNKLVIGLFAMLY